MKKRKSNIDILVGCQYGSEGKGLVAAEIATLNDHYDWVVSVNSAQAGHTAYVDDVKIITRHLPSSCLTNHTSLIFIGPGAVINPKVFIEEIKMVESHGIPISNRLYVAETATVIYEDNILYEKNNNHAGRVGSTGEGVSGAVHNKIDRFKSAVIRTHDIMDYEGDLFNICPSDLLWKETGNIFLEGSQGYGLSLFEDCYPYTTSRDTTTAAFLSYARLNPKNVRDIYGVYRTFPIRVGGNSGPMYAETSWEAIANISGYPELAEYTTVTGRLRRIGYWDAKLARKATIINGVNRPILTFANYLDSTIEGVTDSNIWPEDVKKAIRKLGKDIELPWYAISTSKYGEFEYNFL